MPKELKEILSECMREAVSIEDLAEKLEARGVVLVVMCEECRWWDGTNCLNLNGCARCTPNPKWSCPAGKRRV